MEYNFDYLKNPFLNPTNNPTNKMARIQDYVVITSSKGIENLESLIKENIRNGWQPFGGIAAVNSVSESDASLIKPATFAQAMVLYES